MLPGALEYVSLSSPVVLTPKLVVAKVLPCPVSSQLSIQASSLSETLSKIIAVVE